MPRPLRSPRGWGWQRTAPSPGGASSTRRTALTILAYLAPAFIFVVIFTYYPCSSVAGWPSSGGRCGT